MWFDSLTTWLVALVSSGVPLLNEKTAKRIPAEYWANKELIWKDRVAGMSEKEIIRNVERGKYYKPTKNTNTDQALGKQGKDDGATKDVLRVSRGRY